MKTMNIKTIRIDGGTQSRAEINNEIVTEYADALKAGAEFPAVVVFNDGAHNWLADGFHRFHAHNQAGKASISVEIRTGTARDAVLYSLGANGTHGLNRTNADKRKAVQTMLADAEWVKWSDNAIAKACQVTHPFVGSVRASILKPLQDSQTTRTVERNGKTYEQNTSNIGVKQHREAAKSKHEADIEHGGNGATAKPSLTVVQPTPPEDEQEDAVAILSEENDRLNDRLATVAMDATEEERAAALKTITELRAENRLLRINLKAVTQSRDTYMNELAQVKRHCINLQSKIKKAA